MEKDKFGNLVNWYGIILEMQRIYSPVEMGALKKKRRQEPEKIWESLQKMFDPLSNPYTINIDDLVKAYFSTKAIKSAQTL